MKLHSSYKGHLIYAKTEVGYALKWGTYVNGMFMYADTLAGIKKLISGGKK